VSTQYDIDAQRLTIQFTLPKGAYATTFLEEIGKSALKPVAEGHK